MYTYVNIYMYTYFYNCITKYVGMKKILKTYNTMDIGNIFLLNMYI